MAHAGGRPRLYDRAAFLPHVERLLRKSMPERLIAEYIGVPPSTLERWLGTDDEFACAAKMARAEGVEQALDAVRSQGHQWQAEAWRLERRFPEFFGRQDRAALELKDLAAKLGAELGLSAEESSRAVREAESIAAAAMQ